MIARLLMTAAVVLLPRTHAAWGLAMRSEVDALPGDGRARLAWAAGCAAAAAGARLRASPYPTAVAAVLVALVWLDWTASTDAPALTVLACGAAVLSFLHPRRRVATGLLVGGCPLAAHGFTNFTGLWLPPYQYAPLGGYDWLVLSSLVAPALMLAYVGAGVRHAFQADPRNR